MKTEQGRRLPGRDLQVLVRLGCLTGHGLKGYFRPQRVDMRSSNPYLCIRRPEGWSQHDQPVVSNTGDVDRGALSGEGEV